MPKVWETSEFWMTLLGALALVAKAFGVAHTEEMVAKWGPILAGLILQRVLSKTAKPGQIPFVPAK